MNELHPPISVSLLRRIDAACDRFEESWRNGAMPRIEDYLELFQAVERSPLLESLQSLQHELILSQTPGSPSSPPMTVKLPPQHSDKTLLPDVPQRPARTMSPGGPVSGPAKVTLNVIEGPHAGLGFTFQEHDTLFAGRLPKAQLRLEKDLHFSRHHFRLEVNPPTCYLMDLNSRNGTFVNGERVTERYLRDGDVVSGGNTKMVVSVFDPKSVQLEAVDATLETAAPQQSHVERPGPVQINAIVPPASPSARNEAAAILFVGYEILELLGTGDLGTVYRAQRKSTQEICALKVLTPAAHADEISIQAFLREASVLNQLQHPHIIRLIDMGSTGRNVFLATEFVAAIPWDRLVARYTAEKRIRVACGLMSQILSALEYAHARSLVHRDVKPGNVLVFKKDEKLVAKLADFGLAKQYTTAGMSQMTRDGDVLGSLPFMSPDQFLNSREARPTCDLYSAGATLYWMLTGHEPIPLDGHPCKFLAILETPPTPIRQYNAAIPEGLSQLVHRSLEKTAEKRFVSAGEMRQQLRSFVN